MGQQPREKSAQQAETYDGQCEREIDAEHRPHDEISGLDDQPEGILHAGIVAQTMALKRSVADAKLHDKFGFRVNSIKTKQSF